MLEHGTGDRVVLGSNPAAATSPRNFGNSVYPAFQCLSEETLKAVGPLYLVSMPGEVKDPTSPHWECVTCRGLHHSSRRTTPKTTLRIILDFDCLTVSEGKDMTGRP